MTPRSTRFTGISGSSTSAGAPAPKHVVPGDRLLEIPALGLGVELAGEGIVELPNILAIARLFVRGDLDADLLTERDDRRQPPLPQLVVRQTLEAVLELCRVHLLRVG